MRSHYSLAHFATQDITICQINCQYSKTENCGVRTVDDYGLCCSDVEHRRKVLRKVAVSVLRSTGAGEECQQRT